MSPPSTHHDLVVRGGTVVDGTGRPARNADVAVRDGRITAVGRVPGRGAQEIDARGLVVAPGFIDPHTHLDANLFWDPALTPSSTMGVTTVVMANCGYGLAPVADDAARAYVVDVLATVEEVPRDAIERCVPFGWRTFAEYAAVVDTVPKALNVVLQVGHVPLRTAVMGPQAARERPASAEERRRIAALVTAGLEAGAVGFSTDQVVGNVGPGGSALPGQVAEPEELLAVAGALKAGPGPGLFTMAPAALLQGRSERLADLDWHLHLAATSQRPVVVGPVFDRRFDPGIGPDLVDTICRRSRPRARVVPQISTRVFELWGRLDGSGVVVRSLPTLRRAARDGHRGLGALAADEAGRARLREEAAALTPHPVWSGSFDHVTVRYSPTRPDLCGRTVAAIAAESGDGRGPTDALLDLAVADGFETQFASEMANGDDDRLAEMVAHPGAMIGASDAGAHVLSNTDSCYGLWVLEHWVRRRAVLTLERAVFELTARQADLFALGDRGRLVPGLAADLVVFDIDQVTTGPVRFVDDLPGGGRRLVPGASGIHATVVNGAVTDSGAMVTGARAGRRLVPAADAGRATGRQPS